MSKFVRNCESVPLIVNEQCVSLEGQGSFEVPTAVILSLVEEFGDATEGLIRACTPTCRCCTSNVDEDYPGEEEI